MIPNNLKIQGFLSYKELVEINFESLQVASITGQNGAGKSSILDAITWVLFGFARARNDQIINQQSDLAVVSLDFEYEKQSFRVRRSKQMDKPQLLEFYIKDIEKTSWRNLTEHSVNETQKRIHSILRMDYDTFINASFFLQGKADQFTQLSPRERKTILSNILGLEIWENYQQNAKDIRKNLENNENRLIGIKTEILKELANENQVKSQIQEIQNEYEDKKKYKVTHLQLLEQASKLEESKNNAETQLNQLKQEIRRIEINQEKYISRQNQLLFQLKNLNSHILKSQMIEEQFQEWSELRKNLDELNKKAITYRNLDQELIKLKFELDNEKNTLLTQKKHLAERKQEIEEYQKNLPHLEVQLSDLNKNLDELNKTISLKQSYQEKIQSIQGEISAKRQTLKHLEDLNKEKREHLKDFRGAGPYCPFCNQRLTQEHKEKYEALIISEGLERKSLIERENESIYQLSTDLDSLKTKIKQIDELEKQSVFILKNKTETNLLVEQIKKSIFDWEKNQAEEFRKISHAIDLGSSEEKYKGQIKSIEVNLQMLDYDEKMHVLLQKDEDELRGIEDEYRNLISAQSQFEPLSQQLNEVQEDLRTGNLELAEKSRLLEQSEDEFNTLFANLPNIHQLKQDLDTIDIELNQINRKLGAEKQKLDIIERKKIEKETNQSELDLLSIDISRYKKLEEAFSKNGVPALLIEQALPEIETHANELLDRLTYGQLSIHFETQSDYKDKKRQDKKETLDILINDANGHTRAYEMFSGGEAFRINFAIRLALSQVLAKRNGAKLQTLVIDEGFGSQDQSGRSRLIETINLVKKDFAKILIITHLDELKDAFPGRIEVEKTTSGSRVEVMVY